MKRADKPGDEDIADSEKHAEQKHQHRGKSSENLLNKETILDALEITPGQTVLDAGCGNGYMSKEFSRKVGRKGRVYALDPDEIVIAALREETCGSNIVAMVGDITVTTELPASTLDLVYLSTVVHGFSPEQFKGFETEVKRLLRPNGRLAIIEIVKRETPFGPPMNIRFSPDELKAALRLMTQATVEVGEFFYMQLFENRTET
jgi:ubiquinone/menaquinone biosynthesis C-methylase UbiE